MKEKCFFTVLFVLSSGKILCLENKEKSPSSLHTSKEDYHTTQHVLNSSQISFPSSFSSSFSSSSSSSSSYPQSSSSHLSSPVLWDDDDEEDEETEILVFEDESRRKDEEGNDNYDGNDDKNDEGEEDEVETFKIKRNSFSNEDNDAKAAGAGHSSSPKAAALQSNPQSLPLGGGLNGHTGGRTPLFPGFTFPRNPSCGMCSREQNMCQIISGIFTRSPLPYGYSLVTPIPSGVCNITIVEVKPSKNFFALRRKDGTYVLNGNWKIQATGNYGISGALFSYSSSDGIRGEKLESPGPLLEPIDLMIIYQSPNPGIKYEYRVPIHDFIGQQSQTRILPVISSHTGLSGTFNIDQNKYQSNIGQLGTQGTSFISGNGQLSGTNRGSSSNPIYTIPSKAHDNSQSIGSLNKWNNPYLPVRPSGISSVGTRGSVSSGSVPSNGFGQGIGSLYPPQTGSSASHLYKNPVGKRPQETRRKTERFPGVLNTDPRSIPGRTFSYPGNNSLTSQTIKRTGIAYNPGIMSTSSAAGTPLQKRKPPHRTRHNHGSRDILPGPAVGGNGLPPIIPTKHTTYLSGVQPRFPHSNSVITEASKVEIDSTTLNGNDKRKKKKNKKKKGGKRRRNRFQWVFKGLTECSKSCAGGNQTSVYSCERRRKGKVVSDKLCEDILKPKQTFLSCNLKPCPARWVPGEWSDCSVTCGIGVQTRPLLCKQVVSSSLTMMVPEGACLSPKTGNTTKVTQICKMEECPSETPKWRVGEWSSCSTECGVGVRTRAVDCIVMGEVENKEECSSLEAKPDGQETCDMGSCATNTWFFSEWSEKCSNTCGEGTQMRSVTCLMRTDLSDDSCLGSPRPSTVRSCTGNSECGGKWFTGPWSECNVSCGTGREIRDVKCLELKKKRWNVVSDSRCRSDQKPSVSRECILETCRPEWFTSEWSTCSGKCGKGIEEREVKCLDSSLKSSANCYNDTKPETTRPCSPSYCQAENNGHNLPKLGHDLKGAEETFKKETTNYDSMETNVKENDLENPKEENQITDSDDVEYNRNNVLSVQDNKNYDNTEDKEEADNNVKNIDQIVTDEDIISDDNDDKESDDTTEDENTATEENVATNNEHENDGVWKEEIDDDNRQTNELAVVEKVGNEINGIPDKDALGDESLPDKDGQSQEEKTSEKNNKKKKEKKEQEDKDNTKSKKQEKEKEDKETNKINQNKNEEKHKACIDRIKNCHLVFRARLCRLKYYNKLCCLTCQASTR